MNQRSENVLAFIWGFVRPKCFWYFSMLFCTLIFALLTCGSSYAMKILIDMVESSSPKDVVDQAFWPCVGFMLCYLGISLSLRMRNICGRYFYPSVQKAMTTRLHESLQKKEFHYFQDFLLNEQALMMHQNYHLDILTELHQKLQN